MDALFESILSFDFTAKQYFICLGGALLCGLIAAFAASFRSKISKGFFISLIILPLIVHTVITMVNGNVGTGVAVMGAFSLVRFRSVPGKARDIAAIFLAMTAGLACAAGYVAVALIFTAIVAVLIVVLSLIPFGEKTMDLRITVPESLRYAHEFDDLFSEYATSWRLIKAKTTAMGSLYKLTYRIKLKHPEKGQEFIDKLRCRNGNLEIVLSEAFDNGEEL
ncbi:MAG: DUF4956 domain-containing protein [Clostridia bacterium]|nr:DUF4956 domain-containing protein [Clostridia bacterium]